jgi:DNA-binding MarR family transcriptional regulator
MTRRTVKGELEKFTEREGDVWGGFVRTHAAVTRALDADLRQRHGLSLSSYEALLKLAWAPEARLRMSELAEQCLLTPGGVTRLVDRLIRDGLVERHVPAENRRVVLVEITDKGFSLLQAAQQTHLAGVRELFMRHVDDAAAEALAATWAKIGRSRGAASSVA